MGEEGRGGVMRLDGSELGSKSILIFISLL